MNLAKLRSGSTLPLAAGRVCAFAASFFLPMVLARIFAPEVFGTYKQIFLLQATVYGIAQIGMAESLFYFVPAGGERAGRFVANAIVALGLSGLVTAGALVLAAPDLAYRFANPSLAEYLPLLALAMWLILASAPLEIVLTARQRYLRAAAAYGVSNLLKAVLLLVPAIVTRDLRWLMIGTVAYGALRLAATLAVVRGEFGPSLKPGFPLLKEQTLYVLPFAAYGLVEVIQLSVHQFAVSGWTNPATFAVYAVGCLNVPLIELVASPACHVMMVGLREAEANGAPDRGLSLWRDTTVKIAWIVVPSVLALLALGHELIVVLFTSAYAESVPVFRVFVLVLLLSIFQTDGFLRSQAEIRFLFLLGIFKLLVVLATIRPLLLAFGLPGAAGALLLSTAAGKAVALVRMRRGLGCSYRALLPWRSLAGIFGAATAAAVAALLVRRALPPSPTLVLAVTAPVYAAAYLLLVAGARPPRRSRTCAASPAS